MKYLGIIGLLVMSLLIIGCTSNNVIEEPFDDYGVMTAYPVGDGELANKGLCWDDDEVFMFNHKKGEDGNYYWSYSIKPTEELRSYLNKEVNIKGKIIETKISETESCVELVVDKIDLVVK